MHPEDGELTLKELSRGRQLELLDILYFEGYIIWRLKVALLS